MADPDINPCHFEYMPKHSDFTHLMNPAIKNDEFSDAAEDLKEWISIAEQRDQSLEDHLNSRPCECKYSLFYPASTMNATADDTSIQVILDHTEIGWAGVTLDGSGNAVINEAGDYEVGGSVEWDPLGDGGTRGMWIERNARFHINTDTRSMGSSVSIKHMQSCAPRPIALNVNDTLSLFAYQNSGGALNYFGHAYNTQGCTYLWVHKWCQNGTPLLPQGG